MFFKSLILIIYHLNNRSLKDRTIVHDLNTGQVSYSDPPCVSSDFNSLLKTPSIKKVETNKKIYVVYFDQRLGSAHSKRWSK